MLGCAGCGWIPDEADPYPFRCQNAGCDDADHVITPSLDRSAVTWPADESTNPFILYRKLSYSYQLARSRGMADADYVDLVEELDRRVAEVNGQGFEVTPFLERPDLSRHLGLETWVKDETCGVSGSHKARHLFGLLIHLEVVERLGLTSTATAPRLAIASCGNAALGAAVVARAGGRPLDVFVPLWADAKVVSQLEELGATLVACERRPGELGDPAYRALRQAIADGELPFTCQGNENGLTIWGGETIGYEIASRLGGKRLDRLVVQVGGGALASGCIQGLQEAHKLGVLVSMPRIHAVQTQGCFPLKRAYDLLAERILNRLAEERVACTGDAAEFEERRADLILEHMGSPIIDQELEYAAHHRSEFMWPWNEEPQSIAHGILDDETYDWLSVVKGMLASGGYPVVVDEQTLVEANELGRASTRIDVDHTGTSGLAGLIALRRRGLISGHERIAVLFTGVRR